jgi:hypothetical protein
MEIAKPFRRERIVIVLDCSADMSKEYSNVDACRDHGIVGESRLEVVRELLCNFVGLKSRLHERHEFALCSIGSDAQLQWKLDFSASVSRVCKHLSAATPSPGVAASSSSGNNKTVFDVSALFELLSERFDSSVLSARADDELPPYVYRVLFVYGSDARSPHFVAPLSRKAQALRDASYCFFDAIYVHSSAPERAKSVQAIYDALTSSMGANATSYWLANPCGQIDALLLGFGVMLASPLQRPAKQVEFALPVKQCGNGSSASSS